MWRNHLFSQRNKTTKRAVEGEVDGGAGQNLKKGGSRHYREVRNSPSTMKLLSPFVQIGCDFVLIQNGLSLRGPNRLNQHVPEES